MAKKNESYDLTNFFLNRDKIIFYMRLKELSTKKIKFHILCKQCHLSLLHDKLILSGLKYNNLINLDYDSSHFSYDISYTVCGKKIHDYLVVVKEFLEGQKIW